ncbi:type IVB secretion system protein IcmH/DotU [Oxalobacteraceae bacterium A2-2]
MSTQDPLEPQPDPDATMMVPTPGGRRAATPPATQPAGTAGAATATTAASAVHKISGSGLNPLVRAANALLDLVVPLRTTAQPPDLQQLRERLALALKVFETEARADGIDSEAIAAARYILCTLLDETIASTAWGSGVWGTRSLLVAFHNEASGGEKVFLILQRLSQNPAANLDLLELMYVCLSLGLEGRYRVLDQGQAQLATLRERLLQLIRQHRGAYETDLSPAWRGTAPAAASPLRGTPVWVLIAAAAVLLLIVQLVCSVVLNRASDPVFAGLSRIRVARTVAPAPAPAVAPPAASRIAGFLAPEVAQGLVSVRETAERCVITVRGDGMFGSGSAEVQSKLTPLLERIGAALGTLPGKVIVIGHTDDTKPGLSARFPSNYDLSKARAAGVAAVLAQRAGPPQRYSAEGRGDTEPQVANDSAVNRARNRRVEIVVLTPALAP